MSDCLITNVRVVGKSKSKFKSFTSCNNAVTQTLTGVFKLNPSKIRQISRPKNKIAGYFRIRKKVNVDNAAKGFKDSAIGNIKAFTNISGVVNSQLNGEFFFDNTYVDKFAGNITQISNLKNFTSAQKLYPITDFVNENFVDNNTQTPDLFNKIDEGVFLGNYNENLNIGFRVADDNESYIQPFSKSVGGTYRYKCEVTPPTNHPKHSFLFFRIAAPIVGTEVEIPPEYRLYNLILEDPSGNTIIKYKDIYVKGDADYKTQYINYATYISEPEIDNANLYTWEDDYPILNENSGYKLNIDCDIICKAVPFTKGFDFGYEEKVCDIPSLSGNNNDYLALDGAPLSTQSMDLNPSNALRISAIEIANSGGVGVKKDNYVNLYVDFALAGKRLSKVIRPNKLFSSDYDPQIYPESNSIWLSSPDYEQNVYYNTNEKHSEILLNQLNNRAERQFITLVNSNPAQDSGRLTLKFRHEPPRATSELRGGPFDKSFLKEVFDDSEYKSITPVDNYFVVDSLELRVKAKKAPGTNDFALDVVGYSDDKLLNVTPKIGAFLQNKIIPSYIVDENNNYIASELEELLVDINQVGSVPSVSGFKSLDDLGISSESISDKSAYYERTVTSVDAGDHYILSSLPVINSTEFKEYIIPLEIYEDYVDLGKSTDYSMSSYFENLYIDLFPIPSGASIESIELVVYYKPTNAVNLITFGRPNIKQLDRKDIKLLPQGWNKSGDVAINGNIEDSALSIIENIPQSYKDHDTLRTNYSRRWRGVGGDIFFGPYDFSAFDFSFENPQSNQPFLNGFFDLNIVSGSYILSSNYSSSLYSSLPQYSGYYNGQFHIIKNIGLRFDTHQLFPHNTTYTSIDWTRPGDSLYGKICDAFDNAIRISGEFANINFGNVSINDGFALYTRFTPDYNISGVGYNLFNSGVLFSKYNFSNNLEFVLGFENGKITAIFNDINNGITKLQDNQTYDEYQYPLSVIITHEGSGKPARLYCNNELLESPYLKDSIETLAIVSGNSDLVCGYSSGSGVGCNMFVHEIGISSSGNLTDMVVDFQSKKTTVPKFLDGQTHSFIKEQKDTGPVYVVDENNNFIVSELGEFLVDISHYNKFKLHEFIDEDTSAWKLGAFKFCSFSVAFDGFTKRIGKDYLIHNLSHHGSGYESVTNLPLPSSVYASGLAYHTQIENDFLRFNLTDIPDANSNFYAVPPRISKTIPRGYKFDERAIVVDTILEHETEKYIYWKDGKVGPKLIVSLYSKDQDPLYRPSKVNWGLVNRSIHYLEPSGCYEKISSTFNHDDLLDVSEPWALFDSENSITEFSEKYYSKDIDDMFLQFDLVYPCSTFSIGTADGSGLISSTGKIFNSQQCGDPFEAKLKIHSVNVRLEDALTYWQDHNDSMNLYTSGQSIRSEQVDLFINCHEEIFDSGFYLYTSGSPWPKDSGQLNIILASGVSGIIDDSFNLFVKQGGFFNSTLGSSDQIIYLPILMSGGQRRSDELIPLVMTDNTLDQTFSSSISLHTKAKSFAPTQYDQSVSLFTQALTIKEANPSGTMSLFVPNNEIITYSIENQFNLYINNEVETIGMSGVCSLYTTNFGTAGTRGFFTWNYENLGSAIDAIIDSGVPALGANDEIRGVDLICYGDCDNSDRKCEEIPIVLHDLVWYGDSVCVEGGIFRPKGVYTNPNTIAFNTGVGYSGNFYGIRKFSDLLPDSPYIITIKTKTGTDSKIFLPAEYVELDYGSNDYVGYSGVKLAADKDSVPEERQPGNKFGKSVAIKKDVIAVGAPMQTLEYQEGDTTYTLDEAGSVFIYRRDPRPEGYSWPLEEHKSDWKLETKLTLPSGLFKDYFTTTTRNSVDGVAIEYPVTLTQWEVGGEGRQLGHSLDLAINEDVKSFGEDRREILVVGGPSAKWNREFEGLQPSGVNIALLVLTDEFQPTIFIPGIPRRILTYRDVLSAITNKDLLYTYFGSPPINFNVKVIICEPRSDNNDLPSVGFPEPKPDFISNFIIPKNSGIVSDPSNPSRQRIFNAIKSAFETVFPYDTTKVHNNIPVMMGVFLDNTMSLGEIAVEPGLTDFLNYYREYSYASGLRDYNNMPVSGAVYKNIEVSENWISASVTILNDLLDTGRLRSSNEVKLLTSGIGPEFFNTNLDQFNSPPASGGRVYIFEKESGNWNLVQEIKSPVLSNQIDRYGHAVAISDDTNIIGIGSPYIDECCQVWQYRPEAKRQVFFNARSWVDVKNSRTGGTVPRYKELKDQWEQWVQEYGTNYANEILYSNLTPTEKFEIRQFFGINEYEKIFTYNHGSIPYKGDIWSWLAEEYAPTSRLGYSVAVNQDGSIVGFGAPTDSFNAFDDKNLYFTGNNIYGDWSRIGLNYTAGDDKTGSTAFPSWQNNVNAGAVRLFEAKDYYPHSKVVEYGKFGNLQESLNDPLDEGHFNYLSGIFMDKDFRKMPEDEAEIPKDAGLAFIITPGVDAISDEIVDNIVSWLALGDRNLVLVGNDPEWEAGGIYKKSNDIINKLLSRLNSRMRIYPARNRLEALVEPSSVVLPSFRPDGGVGSYIQSVPLQTAYGVGDIRMHYPGFSETMVCYPDERVASINLRSVNQKCELPLVHQGDLRAQFNDYCIRSTPRGPQLLTYPVNWALRLGTNFPPFDCLDPDVPLLPGPLPSGDPVPLLAAALVKQVTVVRPATPPAFTTVPITRIVNRPTRPVAFFVTDELQNEPAFIWNSGTLDYISYSPNVFSMSNRSSPWFIPPVFEDRKGILQARAATTSETLLTKEKVQDIGIVCAEEQVTNNNSKIIAIATIQSESQAALYSVFGDVNIAFYRNMIAKNQRGESNIAQLGGWTGRISFVDAYNESILNTIFTESNNNVTLNVDIDELIAQSLNIYNVIWIANPKNVPNEEQVEKLKAWLNTGNKKLIITHDSTVTQMLTANRVLAALGSNIETLFLPVKSEYAYESYNSFTINPVHPISQGFGLYPISQFFSSGPFFSFKTGETITPIGYINKPIYDDRVLNNDFFRMNPGVDKVSFPAVPGSGYRIFINYVSENTSENNKITVSLANVSTQPDVPFPTLSSPGAVSLLETSDDDPKYSFEKLPADIGYSVDLQPTAPNQIASKYFDIQVKENQETIDFYFSSIDGRIIDSPFIPKTLRILSISGVMMPVENRTGVASYTEIIGYETIQISNGLPRIEYVQNVSGVIKSINDSYCNNENSACVEEGYNNQLIEDGPVVAAQELEMVTNFSAGVNKSRITVISDSNLVQGRYMVDQFNTMSLETVEFIRSLYPNTTFPNPDIFGKQYTQITKIVAPERGSPQKYRAITNNSGCNVNFGSATFNKAISSFDNIDSLYDPNFIQRPISEAWPKGAKPEIIDEIKSGIRDAFWHNEINNYGGYTRYSGIIDGKLYVDAAVNSGMPLLMKEKGYDYLDFDYFSSGYPGDLFGYSLAIQKNKVIVGAPFAAFSDEEINDWNYYAQTMGQSGIELSYNGGAGAVYIYEKTFKGVGPRGTIQPWQFVQKLRPDSINVGQDVNDSGYASNYHILGPHGYTNEFLANNSKITDQFGYNVDIDSDIIVVGAPGHDFGKYTANTSGEFIRKEFNASFAIPDRIVIELGNSGIRAEIQSGISVINNGAVFTFEYSIDDWTNRSQKWKFIEKVLPQGENSRTQLLNENDSFGRSVSVDRSNRTDSDYVIAIGSENHDYSSSGTNFIPSGGAAYTNDIMLRQFPPIAPDPNTYIDYKVFGSKLYDEYILQNVTTNSEPNKEYTTSGIVYTDRLGNLFLEASGQDPVARGFIQHRPYVVSVEGVYFNGIESSGNLPLYVGGRWDDIIQNMNMTLVGTTGNVYNTLGMYTSSIVDFGSGILNLSINKDAITISDSGVFLYASGIGNNSDTLNMRIRGY